MPCKAFPARAVPPPPQARRSKAPLSEWMSGSCATIAGPESALGAKVPNKKSI